MLDLILSHSVQETCCEACFHHQRECYRQRMDAETIEQREARLAWRQKRCCSSRGTKVNGIWWPERREASTKKTKGNLNHLLPKSQALPSCDWKIQMVKFTKWQCFIMSYHSLLTSLLQKTWEKITYCHEIGIQIDQNNIATSIINEPILIFAYNPITYNIEFQLSNY